MNFLTSGEQFSNKGFLAYAAKLADADAAAAWDDMIRQLDADPRKNDLLTLQAPILGAVALQRIGQFKPESNGAGEIVLTAQGTTALQSSTSRRGARYVTHAEVAAKTGHFRYPHITLSRAVLMTDDFRTLIDPPETFTLPLVIVGEDEYPSAFVMHGALATLMDSDWHMPDRNNAWPPTL